MSIVSLKHQSLQIWVKSTCIQWLVTSKKIRRIERGSLKTARANRHSAASISKQLISFIGSSSGAMASESMSSFWDLSFDGIVQGESLPAKAHSPQLPDRGRSLLVSISCIPTTRSICLFDSNYSSSPFLFEDLRSIEISVNVLTHLIGSIHFESFADIIFAHLPETLSALTALRSIDPQCVFIMLFSGFPQS